MDNIPTSFQSNRLYIKFWIGVQSLLIFIFSIFLPAYMFWLFHHEYPDMKIGEWVMFVFFTLLFLWGFGFFLLHNIRRFIRELDSSIEITQTGLTKRSPKETQEYKWADLSSIYCERRVQYFFIPALEYSFYNVLWKDGRRLSIDNAIRHHKKLIEIITKQTTFKKEQS